MNQASAIVPQPGRRWRLSSLKSLLAGRTSAETVVEEQSTLKTDNTGERVDPAAVPDGAADVGVARLVADEEAALPSAAVASETPAPSAPPPALPPSPSPPEMSGRRRGQPAVPDSAAEEIQARLFSLLGAASLGSGGFDTDAVLHKLCLHPPHVDDLCGLLAAPFIDGSKKIAAVIGLGGYGGVLAFGVARMLPPFPFGEGEFRPASFLSMDRGAIDKHPGWHLASPKEAGSVLRNKRVLIVAPVLTAATCADIQACVNILEEGLGVNAMVAGVSALFQLQCSGSLPRGRVKGFETRSVLRLDFQTHSAKVS